MSIKRIAWLSVLCILLVVAGGAATGVIAHEEANHDDDDGNETETAADNPVEQLITVREATAQYQNVSTAEADGYQAVGECVGIPGVGAMGIHYLNTDLIGDAELNATQPEVLVYAPTDDGELRLVSVEYFVVTEAWHETHDIEKPTLFGQEFNGPMRGHGEGEPVHYDLHVWLWEVNPDGLFAQFNPFVSC